MSGLLGLLSHTSRWLPRIAADLATLPSACPEAPDPCGVAGPSPNGAADSPEPLSPTMVPSQGFLNLLLWVPEDEEFPEVGLCGALPAGLYEVLPPQDPAL